MKKELGIIAGLTLFIFASLLRYRQLNTSFPSTVTIHELSLPHTYHSDVATIIVDHYEIDEEVDKHSGQDYLYVTLDLEIISHLDGARPLSLLLNQLVIFNHTYHTGSVQKPRSGDDPQNILIYPEERCHFEAEYEVEKMEYLDQNVFIAAYPYFYEEAYFHNINNNKLYYELLPIRGGYDFLRFLPNIPKKKTLLVNSHLSFCHMGDDRIGFYKKYGG